MGIKYHINEEFFCTWSKEMSYMLGYIYADGNIGDYPYMRAKYLEIDSTDKETLVTMRSWLSSEHNITQRTSPWKNGKDLFTLRIGSHAMFDSLTRLGLTPRKSLTMTFPVIPDTYFFDFVRGYFDGDGCVHLEKIIRRNGRLRPKKLNVIFTSGSKDFLVSLARLLYDKVDMRLQKILRGKTAFQLRYGTNDSVKLFSELYKGCKKGDYLERKFKVFMEFFKLRKRPCGEDS